MEEEFKVVLRSITTFQGSIMIARQSKGEDKKEWIFPGFYLGKDEEPRESIQRKMKEEAGLDVEVHQLIDVTSCTWNNQEGLLEIFFHCEAERKEAETGDKLDEVKWVEPSSLEKELGNESYRKIDEMEEIGHLIERIKKLNP